MQRIELDQATLDWTPDFLEPDEANVAFAALRTAIPWEIHRIRLFGRWMDSPRLSCWIGDADAAYRYSGVRFEPRPWTPVLTALRQQVEEASNACFNSVLANLYRDGRDAMGWHSDDETELGPEPVIASLSLGAARRFRLKPKRGGESFAIELTPGSLLVMRGATQTHWRHALPRTARPVGERINLTFRWVTAKP